MIEALRSDIDQTSPASTDSLNGNNNKGPYSHLAIDSDLAQRFLARDPQAWDTVIERRHDLLINSFMRRGLSRQDAQDVAQTIWQNTWEHLESYDPTKGELGAWLNIVGRNALFDSLRRQVRESLRSDFSTIPEAKVPSAEEEVVADETGLEIVQAFDTLPNSMRDSCLLRFIGGYTHPEIAAIQNENVSTVAMRVHRGKYILQENLQQVIEDLTT